MNFRTLLVIISVIALVFSSCKKDDDEGDPNVPVLDKNFSFTVSDNDVTFTTTLPGNVWFTSCKTGTEYPATDGQASVKIYIQGTYKFLCGALIEGITYTSDTFNVSILVSDLTFLESGEWLWLTGGHVGDNAVTKTWKLDMNTNGKCVYFEGPLYYSGYADGDDKREEWVYWAWDVMPDELPYAVNGIDQTSFFNWEPDYAGNQWIMAAQNYGTITFNGVDLTVSTTIFGETEDGSFDFDPTTMKLTINNCVLPIDTARLDEGQYEESDLHNVRIFSLADSSMQIGIKRTYEGGNLSQWVNVYNFICDDYDYPVVEEFTFNEAPKTSITASDLVGTWNIADIPMGWIGYTKVGDLGTTIPARLFEKWDTRADVVATLESWDLAGIDSTFTANDANTYVFNADGTCTLNGVANTYSVSDGIITLADTLQQTEFNMQAGWLSHILKGSAITVIDVNNYGSEEEYEAYTPEGIWIGQQNGDKSEYNGFQLVKQ